MALGDIEIYSEGAFGYPGDNTWSVQAQSTLTPELNDGEVAIRALGAGAYVTAIASSTNTKPVVGTDYIAGITTTSSTETGSVNGTVQVMNFSTQTSFLIAPLVAATYGVGATPSQSTYDALIGSRVLLNVSAATNGVNTYTILAADSANNGLVVLPLDVTKFPGKVRFAFRGALSFLA